MNIVHHGIERCPTIVRFPLKIQVPSGSHSDIMQAAEAVKQEYRSSVKWKKLRCREVLPSDDGPVFKIDLEQFRSEQPTDPARTTSKCAESISAARSMPDFCCKQGTPTHAGF